MKRVPWQPEEIEILRRAYPHNRTDKIARVLGRSLTTVHGMAYKLGLRKTAKYLASPDACRLRRRGEVGKAHRFKKGQVPPNKGLRRPGWAPGRMRETQFKKGVRQGVAVKLYQPIGTTRISKDGYLERKVNDDLPLQARWRAEHLLLWEEHLGPVPPGHMVIFKNGDRRDIRIDNLALISRAENMRRNTLHRYPKDVVQLIQLRGALNRKINRRSKQA